MRNLLEDLSILTTVGKYNYEELANKTIAILSHNVEESICDKEELVTTDIGIGQLTIACIEDKIYYKFIPSRKLENSIKDTYRNKQSALKLEIDKTLGKRITNTYKDLF